MFMNFTPMYAATDSAVPNGNGKVGGSLTEFPAEQPSEKELSDWLDANLPLLRQAFGAALRNEIPSHLKQYASGPDDLTGFTKVSLSPLPDGMRLDQAMQHNRRVDVAMAEKATRASQLAQGLKEHKDGLAQILVTAMRRKAPLRMKALLAKHKVTEDCYDGAAMLKTIIGQKGTAGMFEEIRDHDRAVEEMRDNFLPDGCDASEYSDKVNTLINDHVGHLERPLDVGTAALGRFIIKLMPRANATEGRLLEAELEEKGQLDDATVVAAFTITIKPAHFFLGNNVIVHDGSEVGAP